MNLFAVINSKYKMSVLGKCDCCWDCCPDCCWECSSDCCGDCSSDCCSKCSTGAIVAIIIASVLGTAIFTSFWVGVGLYLFHSSKRMIGLLLVIISGSVIFVSFVCSSDICGSITEHLGDCCIYLWNCSSRVRQCWQDRQRVHSHASVR